MDHTAWQTAPPPGQAKARKGSLRLVSQPPSRVPQLGQLQLRGASSEGFRLRIPRRLRRRQ
eukprot:986899-Amphidinium_carterae.1